MKCIAALALLAAPALAFMPPAPMVQQRSEVVMSAQRDWKKDVAKAAFVAMPMLMPLIAGAKIDYEGVGYLGGSDKVDINNANVRVYAKFPGMYPSAAGKIVSHGPYKSVADLYNIPGLTDGEKAAIKKYESKFITLDPAPEYTIDRINNGLYR